MEILFFWVIGMIVSLVCLIHCSNKSMRYYSTQDFKPVAYFCAAITSILLSWLGVAIAILLTVMIPNENNIKKLEIYKRKKRRNNL